MDSSAFQLFLLITTRESSPALPQMVHPAQQAARSWVSTFVFIPCGLVQPHSYHQGQLCYFAKARFMAHSANCCIGGEQSLEPAVLLCTKANSSSCRLWEESIFSHPCHHLAYEGRAWIYSPECCSWRRHCQFSLVLHPAAREGKRQLCAALSCFW